MYLKKPTDWECKIILKVFENKQTEKPKQDSQNGLKTDYNIFKKDVVYKYHIFSE
jgi:hypothetical protein